MASAQYADRSLDLTLSAPVQVRSPDALGPVGIPRFRFPTSTPTPKTQGRGGGGSSSGGGGRRGALAGTRLLRRLLGASQASGAKVVLMGDPHQLPSVDAGVCSGPWCPVRTAPRAGLRRPATARPRPHGPRFRRPSRCHTLRSH